MNAWRKCALVTSMLGIGGCSDSQSPPPLPQDLNVVPIASGLSSPVFLTAPANDPRLFIVEQTGRIRVIKNGQLLATPYLDVTAKIVCCGERGLLGLAFHPQFATNGFFYIKYTPAGGGSTTIERYHATPTADVAEAASAALVLNAPQPQTNHNGGMLAFGPDGMLWIGTGDGGGGGDPQNFGQSLNTLLGKMLRIDVNVAGAGYNIPPNNPFATSSVNRREIWGWGLRNPWRYSFDRETGTLYVADVGQGAWEEVHVVSPSQSSVNYGWRIMEGLHCYNATTCNQSGLDLPVHEYGHPGGHCSITGGYVYRGSAIPNLRGHYLYSDYCTGFLRSFRMHDGVAVDHVEWDVGALGSVLSFGQDAAGELYILSSNGIVGRLSP
jgi:glucose/arabinose dehydrogenase